MVGKLQLDVGLPGDVSIAAVADDVIELANAAASAQPERPDVEFETTDGKWTLARLGAEPFDPHRSLAECNICDGEVLVIREIGIPCAPLLFDDLDVDTRAPGRHRRRELVRDAPMIGCFAVGLIASVVAALLLVRQSPPLPAVAAALAVGAVCAVAGCALGHGTANTPVAPWFTALAIPLIFAGSLHIVSSGSDVSSLPIAFGLTGLFALVALLTSGRGRSFHTAVIAFSVLGTATTVSVLAVVSRAADDRRGFGHRVGDRGLPRPPGDDRVVEVTGAPGTHRRGAARRYRDAGRDHGGRCERRRQTSHPHRGGHDRACPAIQPVPDRVSWPLPRSLPSSAATWRST